MQLAVFYTLGFVIMLNLILSVVILSRGVRESINAFFGFISLSVTLWCISILGFFYIEFSGIDRAVWILLSHSFAALISVAFFSFGLYFPAPLRGVTSHRLRLVVSAAPFFTLLYLLFSSNVIIGEVHGQSYEIGPAYPLYALVTLGYFFSGFFGLLTQRRRTDDKRVRLQIDYIILGTILASTLALITDLILPYFSVFSYIWLGPTFTFILVGTLAYAILRHNLFNIKVVATELLTFGIWVALFVQVLNAERTSDRVFGSILLVLVIGFGITLIRSVLREVEQRERIEMLATELAAANEELKKLDAAKSEFISLASHQLRAPLTIIKGYVSMLLEGTLGSVTALIQESMKKVSISAEQLVRLVGDLLDLSRIETGRLRYDMKPITLDAIVTEVVAEVEPSAKQKGLTLRFVTNGPKAQPVNADADKIREVIMNLLDNAMKYTAKGAVTVELTVEKRAGHPWVVYRVTDSGIGIKPADIPRLFTKFARTDEARRIRADGMGLGLYLVKRIVEDHGGEVRATSPGVGQGSTFTVALPGLNPRSASRGSTNTWRRR